MNTFRTAEENRPLEGSNDDLLELYRLMLAIRLCEESFVEPIARGKIKCPVHLCSGQEAIAAGVCGSLSHVDYVFGSHRSHGHFLAQGGSIADLVTEVYCKEVGCARGRGGSMHLINPETGMMGAAPIVAGTISLALGAALAAQIRADRRVAVSFFGDGATGEGVLYEALNFAALKRLPILFVCENNLYSTHMPIRELRVDQPVAAIAAPFQISAWTIDGNDVLAVRQVAAAAIEQCRGGEGPAFIECLTYRLRGHVGPDDNIQGTSTDIRPADEVARWREADPITRFTERITSQCGIHPDELESIRASLQLEIAEAHSLAERSPAPNVAEIGRHVFRN